MTEPILAVDFGTTTTAAVLVTGAGTQGVEEPSGRGRTWPSAVYANGATLLVGSAARAERHVHPERFRDAFKPELGGDRPIRLGDRSFPVVELAAAVLAAVKRAAEQLHGSPVDRGLFTVPAEAARYPARTEAMVEAAHRAGFETVELLAEPVAAALGPLGGTPPAAGSLLLVYDLGGGTFDTALVRVDRDGHTVLGQAGITGGGRELDAALYRELAAGSGPELVASLGRPGTRGRLADLTVGLRHRLTDTPFAEQSFDLAGAPAGGVRLSAGRTRLEALAAPLLADTVACVQGLLAGCGVGPAEVTAVLLAGGLSRMPAVAPGLRALGLPTVSTPDPELAVVRGAAVFAAGAARRVAPAWPQEPRERPMRWRLPGDCGTLLHWLLAPGDRYRTGQPIGRVRLGDGAVLALCAEADGTVAEVHAAPGTTVCTGDWLVTGLADAAGPNA
ncbi:Hsp70 family protein [Kitasatospora sp. NPDC058965]|uniref:Hsp70 family protein n=1 Tax=Kitasatospora sp. NPDC058965 TaxID=3346682 RepID=UPI0036BAD97C